MPVTTAPSAEACQVIVDRINSGSGGAYTLPEEVGYVYEFEHDLKDLGSRLHVVVHHEDEKDLDQTIENEQRTSHDIRVWIRKRVADKQNATINALKLIGRLIFQRLNSPDTDTSRVKVWECNIDNEEDEPNKSLMREHGVFEMSIALRVEVEPS